MASDQIISSNCIYFLTNIFFWKLSMQFLEFFFVVLLGQIISISWPDNAIIILIYQMKFYYIEQLTKRYLCTILCLKTNVLILKHLRSAPAVYPWNNQQHQQQYPSYNSYSNGLPEQVKHFLPSIQSICTLLLSFLQS